MDRTLNANLNVTSPSWPFLKKISGTIQRVRPVGPTWGQEGGRGMEICPWPSFSPDSCLPASSQHKEIL